MARKTNKTDHVLSLLSGAEPAPEKVEKTKQEPKQDDADKAVSTVTHQGSVHVVVAKGKEGDPVAEIVKEKLQEELDRQEELERQEKQEEILSEKEEEPFPAQNTYMPQEASAPQEAQESPMPEAEPPDTEEEPPAPEEPKEMDGYVFYNIMEKIVQDKAMKYMKQFGNCTCRRCEADTIALSLSKLPPKYVVVKKDSVSPLLNFYEDHFAGQIIVEITKACIIVNKNPRHNRT